MVQMFTLMRGRVGDHIHMHMCVYIYIQTKIYLRNMGATWGNRVTPCTGKKTHV